MTTEEKDLDSMSSEERKEYIDTLSKEVDKENISKEQEKDIEVENDKENELTAEDRIKHLEEKLEKVSKQNSGRNIHIKDQKSIIVDQKKEIERLKSEIENNKVTDDDFYNNPREAAKKDRENERLEKQLLKQQAELSVQEKVNDFYDTFDSFKDNIDPFVKVVVESMKSDGKDATEEQVEALRNNIDDEIFDYFANGNDKRKLYRWARKAEKLSMAESIKKDIGLLQQSDRKQKRENAEKYKSSTQFGDSKEVDILDADIDSMSGNDLKEYINKLHSLI